VTNPPTEATTLLRQAGLRVTAPRLAILAALTETTGHPDAETIAAAARARLGSLSTQAVYNVLRGLEQARLVRCIEPAGGPTRYEVRVGDNHHHIICRSCRTAADVDCVVGEAPCLEPSSTSGFTIDEAEVIFWGRCPECVAATSVSSGELKRIGSVRHQLGGTASDPEQPTSRATRHQKETPTEEKDQSD
jgi:Fur family ferric uptake transcriptional regulator